MPSVKICICPKDTDTTIIKHRIGLENGAVPSAYRYLCMQHIQSEWYSPFKAINSDQGN